MAKRKTGVFFYLFPARNAGKAVDVRGKQKKAWVGKVPHYEEEKKVRIQGKKEREGGREKPGGYKRKRRRK